MMLKALFFESLDEITGDPTQLELDTIDSLVRTKEFRFDLVT